MGDSKTEPFTCMLTSGPKPFSYSTYIHVIATGYSFSHFARLVVNIVTHQMNWNFCFLHIRQFTIRCNPYEWNKSFEAVCLCHLPHPPSWTRIAELYSRPLSTTEQEDRPNDQAHSAIYLWSLDQFSISIRWFVVFHVGTSPVGVWHGPPEGSHMHPVCLQV